MPAAKLTNRGRVTIPKVVRDSLHLQPGDSINFVITGNGEALLKPVTKRVADVFGRLYQAGRKPVSVEEMDARLSGCECVVTFDKRAAKSELFEILR